MVLDNTVTGHVRACVRRGETWATTSGRCIGGWVSFNAVLVVSGSCPRCRVTTIDQNAQVFGKRDNSGLSDSVWLCRKRFGYEVTLQAGSCFRGSLNVPWPPL